MWCGVKMMTSKKVSHNIMSYPFLSWETAPRFYGISVTEMIGSQLKDVSTQHQNNLLCIFLYYNFIRFDEFVCSINSFWR